MGRGSGGGGRGGGAGGGGARGGGGAKPKASGGGGGAAATANTGKRLTPQQELDKARAIGPQRSQSDDQNKFERRSKQSLLNQLKRLDKKYISPKTAKPEIIKRLNEQVRLAARRKNNRNNPGTRKRVDRFESITNQDAPKGRRGNTLGGL